MSWKWLGWLYFARQNTLIVLENERSDFSLKSNEAKEASYFSSAAQPGLVTTQNTPKRHRCIRAMPQVNEVASHFANQPVTLGSDGLRSVAILAR